MTRNVLGLASTNPDWILPAQPVGLFSRFCDDALIVSDRKTLNVWTHKYINDDRDRMVDYLNETPICSSKMPDSTEFSCGLVGNSAPSSPQEILVSSQWAEALRNKRKPPQPAISAGVEWNRIFGAIMPFTERIDLVDGYLINDFRRQHGLLTEIVRSCFTKFQGTLALHFLKPSEVTDVSTNQMSEQAIAKSLSLLKSHLSPTAQKKFEARLYSQQSSGRAKVKLHDRHLYFSFSGSTAGLHYSLGNGVQTFDPEKLEGSLGYIPSGGWTGISRQLEELIDTAATKRLAGFMESLG